MNAPTIPSSTPRPQQQQQQQYQYQHAQQYQQQQLQQAPKNALTVKQQNSLVLAVALASLGTYAFYTSVGDLPTVIYTIGGAYVLRTLMANPEVMRQLQGRVAAMQQKNGSGHHVQLVDPSNNSNALPRIDTSFNHVPHTGYQPLHAVNASSGRYDDFENSMATPTTPDPGYAPLPPMNAATRQMTMNSSSGASTAQQSSSSSANVTVTSATPTARNAPTIGMNGGLAAPTQDQRASISSTFSAFAIPLTNPFASYQHFDAGTINGERLLRPVNEDENHPGPLDNGSYLNPNSGLDARASISSVFSAFAIPSLNPFSSYSHFDAGTINGERVVAESETLSERIAAPPRSDTAMTVTPFNVPHSAYDDGAIAGVKLARRASRGYTGVTGVGLPGAGSGAVSVGPLSIRADSIVSANAPTTAVSLNEYVPKRKHRQPTIAARVGEVAPPGGGIAPPPEESTASAAYTLAIQPQVEQAPSRMPPRPPTPVARKRSQSRPETVDRPLPTPAVDSRVELPARRSAATPVNRTSSASPLNRLVTASPLRRSNSGSGSRPAPPPTSPIPPVPTRIMSPQPEPPVRFFDAPLVTSPASPSSIHPISPPIATFLASATATAHKSSASRSTSGYDSDSSHASSSTSSRRSQERRQAILNSLASHARTDSLGLPSYEKHATTIFTLVPKRAGYVPQIQAILKAARTQWLALSGTVSHEVGQDDATGSVVVVETYESSEAMEEFEHSDERDTILRRLHTFIDEERTSVVRLPGSSAVTRLR